MKKLLLIVICLISQMLFGQTATAPSAGDGTSGAPYQIATLDNLYWIAENSSRWGYHYIQTSNIDASETANWFSNGAGGYYGWTPIGNWTNKFSGVYDGNGHIIDSLYINRPDVQFLGLFGATGGATILKVGVTNVNISGYLRIGAVVGCTDNNSTVKLCFSTGILAGTSNFIGGLVGNNRYSTISDCYSRANVSGYWSNGGLIGENAWSSVSNCYSTGTAQGGSTGGLIGYNYESTVSNSFWDIETSGLTISDGGIGKTTAEMKTQATFTDAGWDFATVWEIITYTNNGYPVLRWQSLPPAPFPPSAGDGSIENPYQIATLENLYWIAVDNSRWNKHYIQIADIDASSTSSWSGGGWIPIGNEATKFNGSYNGNGHLIDGLYINRGGTDHQGLFGYTNGATFSNLGVTNVNITTYRKVGAIGGTIENTTVMNCYSSGSISGSFIIGSLVGITYSSTIINCYSRASVSGETTIGGLVGYNYTGSTVSNCYSTGSVSGNAGTVGGLVGYNWNASITNSFWDTETSGQLTSAGGTGKTTAEMKTNSTFLDAGWNPEIWNMGDGINDGYPYLVWQNPSGTSLFQTPILSSPSNNTKGISITPTLSWTAVSGADKYRLEVNTQTDFLGIIVFDEDTLTDTAHTITGLLNDINYFWRVTALNNSGYSSDTSSTFSFTTKLSTTTLILPENNSTDVSLIPSLSWSAVAGADKYKLEVNTQYDFAGIIIFDGDTVGLSSKQIGGLTDNTKYYWRVTALNNSGNSSDTSSTFDFTTNQSVLSSVSDGATAVSTSPTLSWDKTTGASTYRLEVNTESDFTGTIVFDNAAIADTFQAISGLSNNTTYYWRVTARSNVLLKTNTSTVYSFTTKLSTTTLILPENNSTDVSLIPTLSWSAVAGADKYKLEVNTQYDFAGTIIFDEDTLTNTSHIITGLQNDSNYFWRVTALNNSTNTSDTSSTFKFTTEKLTGIEVLKDIIPDSYKAFQNYPNPFNPSTRISWQSPVGSWQTLKIYDVLGNEVVTLVDEYKSAGRYEVEFDASNLSSGIYFYKLRAGSFVETKKMILLK
ncbi:MAG: T9SS type A sorting domain-containing protein [Ignavibacteriaceae bacterium]|nr:T9SS type A sorting domain-containing protein [Ignavibacteriaceae bacterium]